MSLGELFVIILVAVLVMKPTDLPIIINKARNLSSFLAKLKQEILHYFSDQFNITKTQEKTINIENKLSEINFYLERIIQIEGKYNGSYELDPIRKKYLEITKNSLLK